MESRWWALILLAAVGAVDTLSEVRFPEDGKRSTGDIYDGSDTPWAMQISESEHRNVFSSERVRWTPSRSRFKPRLELEDELPLEEHQRRIQQDRDRRPGTQLENLGGGILMDEDEEGDEEGEEVHYPTRKPSTPRRAENGGKGYPFTDLKSLLKASGPSSLSEVLQQKNLSLEDFLRGSRNALSAITSSLNKQREQQFKRPERRPPVIRRRPTTTTTTASPALSSGDPSRDILELIWQDDEGPTIAEILSLRNMTVEDLIKQKERAAGREDITELFGVVEEGRNVAHFDILETDWNGDEPSEGDQEVTQSRTIYHVVSLADTQTLDESIKSIGNQAAHHPSEKGKESQGMAMGVKSAIIASGCLLGIAMLIFLAIFATFRYRQWRRGGGTSPYFCVDGGWSEGRLWRTLRRGRCRFYDRQVGQV